VWLGQVMPRYVRIDLVILGHISLGQVRSG